MATSRKFSRERCLKNCERLPDAHRRARCCADCLALHLATRREKKRAAKRRPRKSARSLALPVERRPRNRRLDLLFAAPPPSTTATVAPKKEAPKKEAPKKKRTRSKRRRRGAPPVAGIHGLGDAASDRREALAASGGIAAAALVICNVGYASDPQGKAQCIAAVNALHTVADSLITEATASGPSAESTAEIDAALEQMRLNLEDIEGQAQVNMQAKAEARRREEDERRREEESTQNRNLLIGGGVVLAVLAAGAGYVLLKDDDEAA